MKIIITNNIALNGGDAAILLGMVKALKQRFGQDTQFVVTGTYPEICSELYPDFVWHPVIGRVADTTPFNHVRIIGRIARLIKRCRFYAAAYLRRYNIPLYKLLLNKNDAKTLEEYATSDYIISSGGTYLIEPYGITAQYIDYRISIILGKPLIQYTQSMGPFKREQTKNRLRSVFNHCKTILLRDKKSAENVLSLNINNPSIVHVVPDAAFALGDVDYLMSRKDDSIDKYRNVAISVREWKHTSNKNTMPNYRKSIANSVMKLIELGYRVHFFSTCQGISYYTDDNQEVDQILALVPEHYHKKIVKYDEYLPIPKIIDLLKQMDFIIATRLHMSILALISGTPVYPIAYEFKTVELYTSLGYDNVDTLETIDPDTMSDSVLAFIEWYSSTRRLDIYNRVAEYIKDTMRVAELIK